MSVKYIKLIDKAGDYSKLVNTEEKEEVRRLKKEGWKEHKPRKTRKK